MVEQVIVSAEVDENVEITPVQGEPGNDVAKGFWSKGQLAAPEGMWPYRLLVKAANPNRRMFGAFCRQDLCLGHACLIRVVEVGMVIADGVKGKKGSGGHDGSLLSSGGTKLQHAR